MNQPQSPLSGSILKIALPVVGGRLHSHFGGCAFFALVEADPHSRTILSSRTVAAPPHTPGFFPGWLRAQGVQAVIAGGIGQRALELFAAQGIEVRAGEPGAPAEELVARYLNGTLTGAPSGCSEHGHHHEHDGAPSGNPGNKA